MLRDPSGAQSSWTSNLHTKIGYIRDIFGKELVYAMPVWDLEDSLMFLLERYKDLQYF